MTASEIYWPYVAYTVSALVALPFLYFFAQRRWTWIALIAALGNLVIAILDGAAPIRGALDPNYVGYNVGFLHVEKGIGVTLVAGSVLIASALSAWLAIRNRPGLAMLIVAGTAAFHIVNIGFPLVDGILSDPSSVTIELGEYLTIPHTVAIPGIIALLLLPFLLAVPWALQRAFETE